MPAPATLEFHPVASIEGPSALRQPVPSSNRRPTCWTTMPATGRQLHRLDGQGLESERFGNAARAGIKTRPRSEAGHFTLNYIGKVATMRFV